MLASIDAIQNDLRYALRLSQRAPFSTASIILVLAIGLGFHIAVFAFYKTFFLAPVPGVHAPERVVIVAGHGALGDDWLPISYPDYRELAGSSRTLSSVAAYQDVRVGFGVEGLPEPVLGELATPGFFEVLGVRPRLGRTLQPEESGSGDPHVVVLSFRLWQDRLDGDPRAVGRKVLINQTPFTIVGVVDEEFVGVDALRAPRLWVPLAAYRAVFPEPDLFLQPGSRTLQLVARLEGGATLELARKELDVLSERLEHESPAEGERDMVLSPLTARISAERGHALRRSAALLLLLSAIFLLVACSNVTNLLLVRGLARRQEIRIRYQLGASRIRLAQQFLTESMLLCLVGGLLALLVAGGLLRLLVALEPPFIPGLAQVSLLGIGECALGLLASLTMSILLGAAPGFQACSSRFLIHQTAGAVLSDARGSLFRGRCSISFQAFLCTVSLACAGFFMVSLFRLEKIDPGFERSDLLLAYLDLKAAGYDENDGRLVQQELLRTLEGSPSVRSVALAGDRLLGGFSIWRDVSVTQAASREEKVLVASEIVSHDYFRCVGIPILRGRGFDSRDRAGSPPTVIVNERMGRLFWPGRDPIGQYVYLDGGPSPVEVVGIARNALHAGLEEAPIPVLYLASAQHDLNRVFLHVRFGHGRRDAARVVRDALSRLSRVPPGKIQTISQVIEQSFWLPRMGTVLLSILALFSLVLAVAGMAGVIAFFAHQRRRDFSIRAALGATRGRILMNAVRWELIAASGGALAGAAVTWLIQVRISSLLYEPEEYRLHVLVAATGLTLLMALVSAALPAIRLASSEPALWLRA